MIKKNVCAIFQKKCDLYWPESTTTPSVFGKYKVILTKEKEQSVNIYRVFKVFNKEVRKYNSIPDYDKRGPGGSMRQVAGSNNS